MGRDDEGGMETLVRSAVVSVVPGSAYRPFLLDNEVALDAEDKVWELFRDFSLGVGFAESGLGRASEGGLELAASNTDGALPSIFLTVDVCWVAGLDAVVG